MIVWFTALGVLGLVYIANFPAVLAVMNPLYAVRFFGAHGFHRLVVQSGFMQTPNIPAILAFAAAKPTLAIDFDDITYYLGRETFLASDEGQMGRFTETLFSFMARNATPATAYFGLPPDRVVEIGLQIDL